MDNADLNKMEKMLIDFKDEIKEEFRHQLGIQAENFQHKLYLVIEGQQALSEKLDRVKADLEGKIGCVVQKLDSVAAKGDATAAKLDVVEVKLDAVAANLKAHRADTEAHSPIYRIKE